MNGERVRISDVGEVLSGGTPSKDRPDYWNGDIPWVSAKDMKQRRLYDTEDHINSAGLENGSRLASSTATLVLARGMTLLSDVPICALGREMAFNQDIKAVVPAGRLEPAYLTYSLLAAKPELLSMVELAGHGTGRLPTDRLKGLEICLPPLSEQQAIAEILGALDDKIELNRRMNETLEAMARAIFKSWFVDFEPVRAKTEGRWRRGQSLPGLPADLYDLFPASFKDSELGKIPKGWHVGNLGEIADNPRIGVSPEHIPDGAVYVGLEHIPKRSIALDSWGTSDGLESGKFQFSAGDVLFGKLRPYFHKVAVAPENGVCSTDILVIRPKSSEWAVFTICLAASTELIEYASALADGTRMPRTNWRDLARYEMVLPPPAVVATFDRHTTPLIQSIQANIHESRTLSAIRDALLPKLISGEIRIGTAEERVARQL